MEARVLELCTSTKALRMAVKNLNVLEHDTYGMCIGLELSVKEGVCEGNPTQVHALTLKEHSELVPK